MSGTRSLTMYTNYTQGQINLHVPAKFCIPDISRTGKSKKEKGLTVGKRINLDRLADVAVDLRNASQGVATLNVHGARAADTFTARTTEGQRRVLLVLDFDQSVQNHRSTGVQVDLVRLNVGLFSWLVRVLRNKHPPMNTAFGPECVRVP